MTIVAFWVGNVTMVTFPPSVNMSGLECTRLAFELIFTGLSNPLCSSAMLMCKT